jgi:hypothetical protein
MTNCHEYYVGVFMYPPPTTPNFKKANKHLHFYFLLHVNSLHYTKGHFRQGSKEQGPMKFNIDIGQEL